MVKYPSKILPLENLAQTDFYPLNICAQEMFLTEEGFESKTGRGLNGFMYILEGECVYSFLGQLIPLKPGSLIYLPKGSRHKCTVLNGRLTYIRIDFNLISIGEKREIIFSTTPMLIKFQNPSNIASLVKSLTACRISPASKEKLKLTALLYDLLYAVSLDSVDPDKRKTEKRIAVGIKYIEDNYYKDFDISEVAERCNLSVSRFRTLFRKATNMSVVEYRENMRMEKACMLLKANLYSISEIAEQLGYNNVYYFSYCFKKRYGISPGKYRF